MTRTSLSFVGCLALCTALVGCSDDGSSSDSGNGGAGNATGSGGSGGTTGAQDIVDTAVGAGSFSTLAQALTAADLVDTLKGPGPFTVFAPTDDAFAGLPAGTLDTLLMPENQQMLADILTYHVVSGEVLAADVVGLTSATTVNGADISIAVQGDTVVLNGSANVTMTDIDASNGVIHVIDAVLLPPTN